MREESTNRPPCKHHKMLGTNCVECGAPFHILNVYAPKDMKLPKYFLQKLQKAIPSTTRIQLVPSEHPTLCEVGFDIEPVKKLFLSTELMELCRERGAVKKSSFYRNALLIVLLIAVLIAMWFASHV